MITECELAIANNEKSETPCDLYPNACRPRTFQAGHLYVSLLSREERASAIERGILGLYRWYSEQSRQRRNWHADTCIDWAAVRTDHSDAVHTIIEGFFAVEQYTPDYVAPLLTLLRRSYGRSQWHIRWGAEEQRHADLWRNAVLALGRRSEGWIDDYVHTLREQVWCLPWESPLHMVFYQVIQERATQVSYANLGRAITSEFSRLETPGDVNLGRACSLIAADEAAHYFFFLEIARLLLYYQPETAIPAFLEVVRMFTMPARTIIPGYEYFGRILHETGIFGRAAHYREVVQVALKALSFPALREAERQVLEGQDALLTDARFTTTLLDIVDFASLENQVRSLFLRNRKHLEQAGLTRGIEGEWQPAWQLERRSL